MDYWAKIFQQWAKTRGKNGQLESCEVPEINKALDNFALDVRVVYKSRQPAKFAGFSTSFRQLLSLLHESKYVEEMDPQPSTFHKTPAT